MSAEEIDTATMRLKIKVRGGENIGVLMDLIDAVGQLRERVEELETKCAKDEEGA